MTYESENQLEPVESAESHAISTLENELLNHIKLNMFAFDLIGIVINSLSAKNVRDVPLSQVICTSLITHLSNDLRAACLVAIRGYFAQTLTLVASLFEKAYSIAAISNDETIAQKWNAHNNPKKLFKPVKDIVREGLTNLGIKNVESQTIAEYRVYQQLCMAKHTNPLYQKPQSFEIENKNVVVTNGPMVNDNAIRSCWFALEHSAFLGYLALCSYSNSHLQDMKDEEYTMISNEIDSLGEARKRLADKAKERWGTEDPFHEKW